MSTSMTPVLRIILLLLSVFSLVAIAGCASQSQVDRLEEDIRLLRTQVNELSIQQQSRDAGLAESLSATDERVEALDQRISTLERVTADLSQAADETARQISDIDSQLDDRAINWVLKHWLTYAAAVVILLIGTFIGVWGHRFKVRSDLAWEANITDSDEASDDNRGD